MSLRDPLILCVDDERHVLLTLRAQMLRQFPDYQVEIAETAAEALTLVDELRAEGVEIPLLITDQIMPGMKGDELLIELHNRHPQILGIMLTGQASAEEVGNAINRGRLYRFLSKPWNELDLSLTVAEALRRYQQDQQIVQQQAALEQANQELTALNVELAQEIQENRRQAELAFRDVLEFNQQIIASAREGVIVWDRDLRYQIWNPFMVELSGIAAEAVLGQQILTVFPFLQENGTYDLIQRALAGETVTGADTPFQVATTQKSGWTSETCNASLNLDRSKRVN